MLQLYSINLCPREWVSALSFVLFLFGKWGAEELHYVHEMKLGVIFTLHDQKIAKFRCFQSLSSHMR